uniref:Peroxidase n=1 Tax=Daphnia galeata TaxID=27404 RepID=A0A8J2RVG5_9CRUS|nr:unnamed protein product [Daphnia galeata]
MMARFRCLNAILLTVLSCFLLPDIDAFSIGDDFLSTLVKRFDSEATQRSSEEIHIPEEELQEALRIGKEYVDKWEKLEAQIAKEDRKSEENSGTSAADEKSTFYSCRHASKQYNPEVMAESKEAAVYLMARKYLSEKLGIPAEKIGGIGQTKNGVSDRQTACDPTSKFRNIDGTCNNLAVPSYGKSSSIFSRLIINSNEGYSDGIGAIRVSKLTKSPLPSPRLISKTILVNDSVPNPAVSLLAMQWGQFLDHDLTSTPTFKNGTTLLTTPHPECLPIIIPANDSTYNPSVNATYTCIQFIRSLYGNNLDGTTPRMRAQINLLTHWIDGSNVYGSTVEKANSLRNTTSGRGRMKTFISNGRHMLPLVSGSSTAFDAGPALAAQVMSPEYGYYDGNPAVFTEFSTAAYRMGHSQVKSFVRLFDKDGRTSRDSYFLSDSFLDPSRLVNNVNFFDNALRGLTQTPAQAVDNNFAEDLTSQLFKPKGKQLGMDLISFNIQRGRDHGLPSYVSMLYYLASNFLLQTQPTSFEHLLPRTPLEVVSAMKSVYESVYDVDLYIGGVTEKPLPNAELGPTFAGIFALQFLNLKRTDRFFYTNNIDQPTGFSSI